MDSMYNIQVGNGQYVNALFRTPVIIDIQGCGYIDR